MKNIVLDVADKLNISNAMKEELAKEALDYVSNNQWRIVFYDMLEDAYGICAVSIEFFKKALDEISNKFGTDNIVMVVCKELDI